MHKLHKLKCTAIQTTKATITHIPEISVAPGEEDNGGIWDGQLYLWYVSLHNKQSDKTEVSSYS